MKKAAADPIEAKVELLHAAFQELKAVASARGVKLRMLVTIETATGQLRKLSTEPAP